ncbi:MAG: hypothetical protein GY765_27770 [bacterium]|nr:hypothetical protein [bacterium]
MISFLIKFFLTNVLFSLAVGLALVKFNQTSSGCDHRKRPLSNLELILYSFGLGPVITALFLYFLLMIVPGQGDLFYFLITTAFFLFLFYMGRKSIPIAVRECKQGVASIAAAFKKSSAQGKATHIAYWLLIVVILFVFLYFFLGSTLHIPMEGHDILAYGNIGKMYYSQKSISYELKIYNKENGFIFTGSPKPSFSLLLTWEMILNNGFGIANKSYGDTRAVFDLYFRSISAYYALLIIFIQFLWLYGKNKYLALLGILVLLSGLRFFLTLINYHLDTYRMFFLLVSWVCLYYTFKRKDGFVLFVFGMFSGFTAFTHLIGFAVALLNGAAFGLFMEESSIKVRLKKSIQFLALFLIFGGLHYVLEALYGARFGFLTYFK